MVNKTEVSVAVNAESHVLEIISGEELVKIWEETTGRKITEVVVSSARTGANYVAPVMDVVLAQRMVNDIGLNGRVVLKNVAGKQYVIFKGLPGTRKIFTGTRYLATNPKVVDMAIGRIGVNKSIVSGARLTVMLAVPLNVLEYLLSDNQSMAYLIGTTATDVAKLGIAAALASIAGAAVGTVTTVAVGPLVAAIVVGVLVSIALDELDQKYGVTDALVKAIEDTYEESMTAMGRFVYRMEQEIIRLYSPRFPTGMPRF